VYRATALSIVLMFVAGPSIPLLCRAWCDLQAAAAAGCHHQDNGSELGSETRVSGDASCLEQALGPIVLAEGLRRQASGDAALIVGITKFRLTAPVWSDRPHDSSGPRPPTQKRSVSTPLRI
jgi:hypothetical protein